MPCRCEADKATKIGVGMKAKKICWNCKVEFEKDIPPGPPAVPHHESCGKPECDKACKDGNHRLFNQCG